MELFIHLDYLLWTVSFEIIDSGDVCRLFKIMIWWHFIYLGAMYLIFLCKLDWCVHAVVWANTERRKHKKWFYAVWMGALQLSTLFLFQFKWCTLAFLDQQSPEQTPVGYGEVALFYQHWLSKLPQWVTDDPWTSVLATDAHRRMKQKREAYWQSCYNAMVMRNKIHFEYFSACDLSYGCEFWL